MLENQKKLIKIQEIKNIQNSTNNNQQNINILNINQNNSTSLSSQEEEINQKNEIFNNGRWTDEEHKKFIEGILEYGNEWKKVQKIIKTRSSTQARSHAQKFFLRIKKSLGDINYDNNLNVDNNDMIKYIIETLNSNKNKENILTNEQKEKLINVINCRYNNNINNNNNNNSNNNNDNNKKKNNNNNNNNRNNNNDIKINNNNNNNININICDKNNNFIEKNGNKIQLRIDIDDENDEINDNLTYKKKKSPQTPSNKIFNISKDLTHRFSIEIPIESKTNENENISLTPFNNIEDNFLFKEYNNEDRNIKQNENNNNPFNIEFRISKDEENQHNKKINFEINEKENILNNYINYQYENDAMQIDDYDVFLNYNINNKNN